MVAIATPLLLSALCLELCHHYLALHTCFTFTRATIMMPLVSIAIPGIYDHRPFQIPEQFKVYLHHPSPTQPEHLAGCTWTVTMATTPHLDSVMPGSSSNGMDPCAQIVMLGRRSSVTDRLCIKSSFPSTTNISPLCTVQVINIGSG